MYHCYFLINYIGPPKVFFLSFAPSLKSLPITDLGNTSRVCIALVAKCKGSVFCSKIFSWILLAVKLIQTQCKILRSNTYLLIFFVVQSPS